MEVDVAEVGQWLGILAIFGGAVARFVRVESAIRDIRRDLERGRATMAAHTTQDSAIIKAIHDLRVSQEARDAAIGERLARIEAKIENGAG